MKPLTLTRGAVLGGALMLLHASSAFARGTSSANAFERTPLHLGTSTTSHTAASSGISGSIVRTVIGLLIVIAVIYGLTWIVRQAKTAKNPSRGIGLEQVASLPLGTNRSVALVRVGSELHLLGIAEHGVTGIRTFTEDEAVDLGLPIAAPGEEPADAGQGSQLGRAVEALRRMTVR